MGSIVFPLSHFNTEVSSQVRITAYRKEHSSPSSALLFARFEQQYSHYELEHALQSYLSPYASLEGSPPFFSLGFSFLLDYPGTPPGTPLVQEERWSVQLPHPKGKSPIVCCCPSVPHGVLLKTSPYFVISNANPMLNLGPASATLRKGPHSARLSQDTPLEFSGQSSWYCVLLAHTQPFS